MEDLLKKIANSIISVVTLTSLIIALNFFNSKDILFISAISLFMIFLYLVSFQMKKLEEEIINVKKEMGYEKRISQIEAKLIKIEK